MKYLYVGDIIDRTDAGEKIGIFGWLKQKRVHKNIIFFDIEDSTGVIQAVIDKASKPQLFNTSQEIQLESSVSIKGTVEEGTDGDKEIHASHLEVLGDARLDLSPKPRQDVDIFASEFADLSLSKRHLYLRNSRLMAVLRFRHKFFRRMHRWFQEQGFLELHTPLLTQIPLYEDETAFDLDFFGTEVFLTQCSAFYLESAVHAFEKVYNLGPSFRAEKSKGKRHLAEYWHAKAEIAFADLEDIIEFVEQMIHYLAKRLTDECADELEKLNVEFKTAVYGQTPFPRITYADALNRLKSRGVDIEWGQGLASQSENLLSEGFETPFWITEIPRDIEPFPYSINPDDFRTTKTADLVAPDGYGEILGVAEKIWRHDELSERAIEKRGEIHKRYNWYFELRKYGSVPHSGFGMGVERTIRWFLNLNHVRDAIPFPRLFYRAPYP